MDLLLYNRFDDQLQVHKVAFSPSQISVENSYFKTVKKDTKIIEDISQGGSNGVLTTWLEVPGSDGFFDIYIAATTENPNGKNLIFGVHN